MYPMSYQDAEIAYRRERLAEAFRAGATRRADGAGRRHHHLPRRKSDRRS